MKIILGFFNHPFFILIGGITSAVAIVSFIILFFSWIFGISPILWKLGLSRWNRKIGIVGEDSKSSLIKADLIQSHIFRKNKIEIIPTNNLALIRDLSITLIHYDSFSEDQIIEMLNYKRSSAGMIIYFPEFLSGNRISDPMLSEINRRSNTIVVNFRGRLLNDILLTFVTTSLVPNE